jgi:hypothetical protein
VIETERLFEQIDAAVRAGEFLRTESLLRKLTARLRKPGKDGPATQWTLVRLQQALALARANRSRLHSELITLQHCKTYLGNSPNAVQMVNLSA